MDQQTSNTSQPGAVDFEFTGNGQEYFKIWIVNLILSILTLGIYSAWAKVRTNRYFYGNTRLAGSGFEYHAKPITILKSRLIAVGLLLIYVLIGNMFPYAGIAFALALTLAIPWMIWRSMQFNARMTSYRNVRFAFQGSMQEAYKYILLFPLLPILITAGIASLMWLTSGSISSGHLALLITSAVLGTYLMLPYIQKTITAYYLNNARFGQGAIAANLSAKPYYITYLKLIGWSLLILVALFMAGLGMMLAAGIGVGAMAQMQGAQAEIPPGAVGLIVAGVALFYLSLVLFGIWTKAYVTANIRNYVFSNTGLDDLMRLQSTMTVSKLFWLYVTNALLLICTLGLAYPWVRVRVARYTATTTRSEINGSLDQYLSQQQTRQSALGEELGEAFDVEAELDLAF
jgi:uncharacterized membrane protein YjgN (DUF898 family)